MKVISKLFVTMSILAPMVMAQSRYTSDILGLNPLGYWRLEANTNDSSPNGSQGTQINSVTYTTAGGGAPIGDVNSIAASFNSSLNQFVNIPAGEPTSTGIFDLEWNHAFTLTIWVKTNEAGSILLAKQENSGNFRGYSLFIDSGSDGVEPVGAGRVALQISSIAASSAIRVSGNVSVNDGAWHFLAATYDGSGQASGVHLYVDGNPVSTNVRQNNLASNSILNNAAVTIGSRDLGGNPTNGLLDEAAIFGVALSAAQIKQIQSDTIVTPQVLSQFTFGGGWYTALYFTNTGTSPVSFTINFTSDTGVPLIVPSLGASTATVNIPARGTAIIEAFNSGAQQSQGYAVVQLPGGVTGYGVFRQTIAGRPDQEAVVPLAGTSTTTSTMIYDDTNFTTTFSVANLSSSPIAVTITARNNLGQIIGSTVVAVVPNGKYANVLRSLSGLGGMAGSRGSVDFTTNTGNISVLGLRFGNVAFTSIPTFDR